MIPNDAHFQHTKGWEKMTEKRDRDICKDYLESGKSIDELTRLYGLSSRRIRQVLDVGNIKLRPAARSNQLCLSGLHRRIGTHLYNYRFDLGREIGGVADDLSMSMIRVRQIERGIGKLELLEILDIASYTKTSLARLLEEKNG